MIARLGPGSRRHRRRVGSPPTFLRGCTRSAGTKSRPRSHSKAPSHAHGTPCWARETPVSRRSFLRITNRASPRRSFCSARGRSLQRGHLRLRRSPQRGHLRLRRRHPLKPSGGRTWTSGGCIWTSAGRNWESAGRLGASDPRMHPGTSVPFPSICADGCPPPDARGCFVVVLLPSSSFAPYHVGAEDRPPLGARKQIVVLPVAFCSPGRRGLAIGDVWRDEDDDLFQRPNRRPGRVPGANADDPPPPMGFHDLPLPATT